LSIPSAFMRAKKALKAVLYKGLVAQLKSCQSQRDAVASQMRTMLGGAAFGGTGFDDAAAQGLVAKSDGLVGDMHELSQMVTPPSYTVCGSSDQQGPQGPGGSNGQNGENGSNGQNGENGGKGDTGGPWWCASWSPSEARL
jgi:hypothetical protein